MTTRDERPFFFSGDQHKLFGILHPPRTTARGRGFVFCYPCFEEKLWVQRVFVSFARELAARGYHVLRFDFAGHGDSDGDFQDSSVTSRLNDLEYAIGVLREEIGATAPVGLLGLRFGATLAALYAERHPEIENLVLWDPLTSGAQYMQEVLLSNLATQSAVYGEIRETREDLARRLEAGGTVNIEGYELGQRYFREANAISLASEKNFRGPCLIVQIGRAQAQKPKKDLESLRSAYPQSESSVASEEPFWKEIKSFYPRAENLFQVTLEWIERHGC